MAHKLAHNSKHNRGGHRVKVQQLYLPKWTVHLPDTTRITAKDIALANDICVATATKLLPQPSQRPTVGGKFCTIPHRVNQWFLGELRKHFQVIEDEK